MQISTAVLMASQGKESGRALACTPFITGRVRTREGVETDKGKQSLQGAL